MSEYTGKKCFVVHRNDAGSTAYRDGYVQWLEAEIGQLQAIIASKLQQRRCHECGYVGWYADSRIPYCLCDKCRSQDTRRVKETTIIRSKA